MNIFALIEIEFIQVENQLLHLIYSITKKIVVVQ